MFEDMLKLSNVLKIVDKYLDITPDASRMLLEINHEILKLLRTSVSPKEVK